MTEEHQLKNSRLLARRIKRMSIDKMRFRIGDLASMVGVSTRQLRYWEQQGYLESRARDDDQQTRMYDFSAYIKANGIKMLLDEGFSLQQAVQRMQDHTQEGEVIHDIMQNALVGVSEIDGERALNLGYFDEAKTQYLFARAGMDGDGPRYTVLDVAQVDQKTDA